jgi:hypothetical protein
MWKKPNKIIPLFVSKKEKNSINLCEMKSKTKSHKIASVGEDVEKRRFLHTVSGNVNQYSYYRTLWTFLKKLRVELSYDTVFLLPVYI